jgi:hypothetical protein
MSVPQPQILSPEESALWRQAYLDAFVDTACDHYQRYIATTRTFSDGVCYTGYLWDCLRSPSRITVQRFRTEVALRQSVMVMADHHSRDRILGPPLWPFPPYSVAVYQSKHLPHCLKSLPWDIYVFDESLAWTLVHTHEWIEKHVSRKKQVNVRLCFAVGITDAA